MPKHETTEEKLTLPGPLRRHRALIIAVLASFLIAPVVGRYLDSYRAVVLEVRDGEMFIQQYNMPPDWKDAPEEVSAGDFLIKEMGQPEPVKAEPQARDAEIMQMYARYSSAWSGAIVKIRDPVKPDGPHVAVVEVDGGGRRYITLWADHLAAAAVGRRMIKHPGKWDPILTDEAAPALLDQQPAADSE